MMRTILVTALCLTAAGCASASTATPAAEQVQGTVEPAKPPEPAPPEPPKLKLEVLTAQQAVGLAIHNEGSETACVSTKLGVHPSEDTAAPGVEVDMPGFGNDEIMLEPGGEWLWPSDWGIGEPAPLQAPLEGFEGSYHFVVRACEAGATLDSEPFELPRSPPTQTSEDAQR